MGFPIPSLQEGACKVGGEDYCLKIHRPGTMKGHGYFTLSSPPVDAVLGDLDVSTGAAWSRGHSAIHSLGHGPLWLFLWMVRQVG